LKSGSQRDICTPLFIAALFTIVKTWKEHKYLLMDECIKKICHIHTIECYSDIKKKEILLYAKTWMNFDDNYAKLNKPVTEGHIPHGFIHIRYLK